MLFLLIEEMCLFNDPVSFRVQLYVGRSLTRPKQVYFGKHGPVRSRRVLNPARSVPPAFSDF